MRKSMNDDIDEIRNESLRIKPALFNTFPALNILFSSHSLVTVDVNYLSDGKPLTHDITTWPAWRE